MNNYMAFSDYDKNHECYNDINKKEKETKKMRTRKNLKTNRTGGL